MGTIIVKNAVVRKKGFLYYVDGQGNVCEAKMGRGRGKKKKEVINIVVLVWLTPTSHFHNHGNRI